MNRSSLSHQHARAGETNVKVDFSIFPISRMNFRTTSWASYMYLFGGCSSYFVKRQFIGEQVLKQLSWYEWRILAHSDWCEWTIITRAEGQLERMRVRARKKWREEINCEVAQWFGFNLSLPVNIKCSCGVTTSQELTEGRSVLWSGRSKRILESMIKVYWYFDWLQ